MRVPAAAVPAAAVPAAAGLRRPKLAGHVNGCIWKGRYAGVLIRQGRKRLVGECRGHIGLVLLFQRNLVEIEQRLGGVVFHEGDLFIEIHFGVTEVIEAQVVVFFDAAPGRMIVGSV